MLHIDNLNYSGLSPVGTVQLRHRLIREITSLERQFEWLRVNAEGADFCHWQTYREMIGCRRSLLRRLPLPRRGT